jgi:hypothetical protein
MIFKILLLLLISSCGIYKVKRKHVHTHPDIEIVRKRLVKMSDGAFGQPDIPTGFVEKFDKESVIGSCDIIVEDGFTPEIDIKRSTWYRYPEDLRLVLLAHEYGHCQCNFFKHFDGVDKWNCPKHFMHSSLGSYWCVIKNFKKYIDQIKQGCEGLKANDKNDDGL